MKIWVDDIREAPSGYEWCKTTERTIELIKLCHISGQEISIIDLDHDAGDFAKFGGDYIKILDYLEMAGISVPIRLHTMNVVGLENMRRIIRKNNWREV